MELLALALSLAGFTCFLALDIGAVRKRAALRIALGAGTTAALVAALLIMVPLGDPLDFHLAVRLFGLAAVLMGGLLLTYSILVEIPLMNPAAYPQDQGNDLARVVNTGTYALCRHPGYLWMLIYLSGLCLAFSATSICLLAVWWACLDLALIVVQDQVVFPKAFDNYKLYQASTPFLIPSRASIRAAVQTLKRPRYEQLPAENN